MKALTLWQPWASLIALGHKTIETRSWPARKSLIGQRIAIHAATRTAGWGRRGTRTDIGPFEVEYDASGLLLRGPIMWPYRLPLGAVVGTAVLADCVQMVAEFWWHDMPPGVLLVTQTCLEYWGKGDNEAHMLIDYTDQRPFGLFEPGRWAWLLTDVERFAEPIPARGAQGLWNWERG